MTLRKAPVKAKCEHGQPMNMDCELCLDDAADKFNAIMQANEAKYIKKDIINHPPHYTQGGIEAIDAIEAALTPEEFRGYCKGNALKYIWREKHKGQNESLKKAIWYLNRATIL